jgi:glycosyltransferase involved in cell wall biosynthesis
MHVGYLLQQGLELRRPPFDGPANHVREVIHALGALGHRVTVVTGAPGTRGAWCSEALEAQTLVRVERMERGPLRLLEGGVRRVQSGLRLPYANLFDSLRFALAAQKALAGCDVLLERMSWMGLGGGLAARWLRVPLVLEYNGDHLHDLEAKGMAPVGLQRRLSLALMAGVVQRSAHVVATGTGWRDHFLRQWRYPAERVTTIENGTALVQLLRRDQLRAFGTPPAPGEPVTLVYLGGFYAWHGVPNLIRAFARARATGQPLRLLLIGSGAGLDEARQLVAGQGVAEAVTFAGHLTAEQFAPLLAQADIGLSPYCGWKEFSGLKLFDYKAAGLAIIASGTNGQPATLKHEQTALIVPPCDEDALTGAMLALAGNAGRRRALGKQARLEAESCHGWDRTARELEHVFRQAIERVH